MVNQARMSAEINEGDLARAASYISAYLVGKQQTPEVAAAAEAFLNTLPKDQIEKLKSLSTRADDYGPKFRPGEVLGYYDVVGPEGRRQKRAAAEIEMRQAIHSLTVFDPNKKEKLLDVIDTVKPLITPQAAPIEMTVQQQQAYLKVLGHDIGKSGLDGVAGKDSMTQKALDEFAKKNGIDPKDTQKVNRALSESVMGTKAAFFLERTQKEIDAGKASPDDIKAVQWLLKGNGAKMPLSLHGDKMDGVAGYETKTILKTRLSEIGTDKIIDRLIGVGNKDVISPGSPELQKFYDSLTPEQRDIQKNIASLGGSQLDGEVVGILHELADGYYHRKEVQRNIYDGGFSLGFGSKFPYRPSDEVGRLREQFDKSLTPEQIKLRDSYIKSDTLPDKRFKLDRDIIEYPIRPRNLSLFQENLTDLLMPAKVSGFPDNDGLGLIKVKGFDVFTDFGKAATGDIVSLMPPKIGSQFSDDVAERREKLQGQSLNPSGIGMK